jgi:hypothetical protein
VKVRFDCNPGNAWSATTTRLSPYSTEDLRRFIAELQRRSPRTVVDLGAVSGLRMRLWKLFAARDATIVNTAWPGDAFDRDTREALAEQRSASHRCFLAHSSRDLAEIRDDLHRCAGRRVDLLFIDGLNPYPLVRGAYDMLRSLVRRGGCMAWDGVTPSAALTEDRDGGDTLWNSVFMLYPRRRLMASEPLGPRGGIALVDC